MTYAEKDGMITSVSGTAAENRDAGMAELADAQASGACGSNIVRVQVPLPALNKQHLNSHEKILWFSSLQRGCQLIPIFSP